MSDSLAELGAILAEVRRQAAGIGPADDAAAFTFVTDLAGALDCVPGLLGLVRDLAEIAALGPVTREHVIARLDELHRTQRRVEADRATLQELRPTLDRLRAAEAERDRLAGELSELRRLEQLAEELGDLQAQRASLAHRKEELATAGHAEREVTESAEVVVVLTERQLAKLDERTSETLTRAERTSRRLAEARKALADEQARLDRLTAELHEAVDGFAVLKEQSERRLPSMEAYRLAERQLLEGIEASPLHGGSGLHQVNNALDDLDRRLAEVKAALKIALATHDEAYAEARAQLSVQ